MKRKSAKTDTLKSQTKEKINLALNAIKTEVLMQMTADGAYNPNNNANSLMESSVTGIETGESTVYTINHADSKITISYVNTAQDINMSGNIDFSEGWSNGGIIHGATENGELGSYPIGLDPIVYIDKNYLLRKSGKLCSYNKEKLSYIESIEATSENLNEVLISNNVKDCWIARENIIYYLTNDNKLYIYKDNESKFLANDINRYYGYKSSGKFFDTNNTYYDYSPVGVYDYDELKFTANNVSAVFYDGNLTKFIYRNKEV